MRAGNGGGVWIAQGSNGRFSMTGGTVSGNSTTYGAGIQVNCQDSIATISGGVIQGNTAEAYGGGIHSDKGATLVVSGSTQIINNTATAGGGAAVYGNYYPEVTSYLTLQSGVVISGNEADGGEGGGLYAPYRAEVLLEGASITNNHTTICAGGVFVGYLGAVFTMTSGVIYGNTADDYAADLASTFMSTVTLIPATDMGLDVNLVDDWYYDQDDARFIDVDSPVVAPISFASGQTPLLDIIAAATHDLVYDANGGSGTVPDSVFNKQTGKTALVGTGDDLSRNGYVFAGWNTAADGSGTGYTPGDTFTFAENTTLYAQWTPSIYA